MMINNNPYNLPQRLPHKTSTSYSQQDSSNLRKTDSVEFPHQLSSPSQYANRSHHPPIPNNNNSLKKSSINLDESIPSYRPPPPPQNVKQFIPSPKNTGSQSFSSLNHYSLSGSRGNISHNSPGERKESINTAPLRESFGIKLLDSKQTNQKIEILTETIKKLDKRIFNLEKTSSVTPSRHSSFKDQETKNAMSDMVQKMFTTYQNEWEENLNSFALQINAIKEQIKTSIKSDDVDRIVHEKAKQLSQITKCSDSVVNSYVIPEESISQIKKETDGLKIQLQDKIRKNYDFLTAVIGRIERQMHSNMNSISASYKPSAIKCSGTAILLRFVESFRVRKNGGKSGQSKLIITDNTYYIDNEGYLLDKDQHYLVDSKGKQVRLEEKHIKMLKQEQVLQ